VNSRGRLLTIAQTICIFVMGWLVWSDAVLPRLRWKSAVDLASEACLFVILGWISAAAIAFAVYFVVSLADFPEAMHFSLRSAAPAMWFAPAVILASTPFPAAFLVSAILVANATRQLISKWAPAGAMGFTAVNPATAMLGSCAAQLGLVAEVWHRPMVASALLASSAAIVTSLALASGAYRPAKESALPHSSLSIAIAFLLAVSLSFGGLRVRMAGGGDGNAGGAGGPASAATASDAGAGRLAPDGDFPGVILLPEIKPQATLLLPPPLRPSLLNAPLAKPVGIPFSGEYWMFRPPFSRPPSRSFVRRGTPTEFSFHTTDGWPIQMEAHQHLEQSVDIRCCTRIQLVITDAESFPAGVSLELLLIDKQTGLAASAGRALAEPGRMSQTLTYSVPRDSRVESFDEIKIVFHRNDARFDKSSKIAIDRFILAP
jgi:hypothetical protein